jgi:hypothetical protein
MSTVHITKTDLSDEFKQRQRFFSGEEQTFASVLLACAVDALETIEFVEWDPDVLAQELKDYYRVDMPIEVRDRLNSLISALASDRFYRDPMFFNQVANALSGEPCNMDVFEPADIDEVAWAVLEVGMNDFEEGEDIAFDPEVEAYVGALLHEAGLKPFPPLEFALDMGQEEGFDMPDEPMMVGAQVEERLDTKTDLLLDLQHRVKLLHRHLEAVGLPTGGRKTERGPRKRRTLPT